MRLENGLSSVMHSSINNANEYVSECIVGETLLVSTSSVAPYLTISPFDNVFEIVPSVISSTILAIAKSQISGSPFRVWSVRSSWAGVNVRPTSRETNTFFYTPEVSRLSQYGGTRNSRI